MAVGAQVLRKGLHGGEWPRREDQVCTEPCIQIMLSQMVWVLHLTLVECQVLVDPPEPGSLQGEGQERVEDVAAKGVHPQIDHIQFFQNKNYPILIGWSILHLTKLIIQKYIKDPKGLTKILTSLFSWGVYIIYPQNPPMESFYSHLRGGLRVTK